MSNKVSEMFSDVTDNFKGMIDANSVVGEPIIVQDGTMIVPISKVSFGFGGGGYEFDSKKNDISGEKNFGGGMGGGASVDAMAFLVINNGNVRLIPMGHGASPVDKLIDLMPDVIDKVNGFFNSRCEKKQNNAENETKDKVNNDDN